jgi:hypothetical protein
MPGAWRKQARGVLDFSTALPASPLGLPSPIGTQRGAQAVHQAVHKLY